MQKVYQLLLLLVAAGTQCSVLSADNQQPTAPIWPDLGATTLIFDSAMPAENIQKQVDAIFAKQEKAEFGAGRYALLFKPGVYHVNLRVGFYTQVAGLGAVPDDVTIVGHVSVDARWARGNATVNFWRSVENIKIVPDGGREQWAVSQASPLRRVHIQGDLALDDHGWSSGGFMADSVIEGKVLSGNQQQWLTHTSRIGAWESSSWNMVFVGVEGAPPESFPAPPYVTVQRAPRLSEKPFLTISSNGKLGVMITPLRLDSTNIDWEAEHSAARILPIENFYIAQATDSATTINAALAAGKNLIFTPGIYELEAPLRIERANTLLLGLGLPTLVVKNPEGALRVSDVDGVKIAGILIAAGATQSKTLLSLGDTTHSGRHAENPAELFDLFFRVGGDAAGKVETALAISSSDVIADDLWIWRADHGSGVGWKINEAARGLIVSGDDVTIYGLAVEHFQSFQTSWNGERGRVYFYQSEEPYDVPAQNEWISAKDTPGFASYKVGEAVKTHEAWGLGVYCFFRRNPTVKLASAVSAPSSPKVIFHDVTTISLGGGIGEISHLVNGEGEEVKAGHIRATLRRFPVESSSH